MRRTSLAIVALAVLSACGGGEAVTSTTAATAANAPGSNEVAMRLIAFNPDRLTIKAGSAVTWRQTDPGVHTVTSGTVTQEGGGVSSHPDGHIDSGELAKDETFRFEFKEPGAFPYFCEIHPATMRGEITVA